MTGAAWGLLLVTGVLAVADWVSRGTENKRLEYFTKPATLVALIGVALTLDPTDPTVRAWFVVALLFSLGGDVLLMLPDAKWFVFGLGSFLVAHLAYVVGLVASGVSAAPFVLGIAVVLVALVSVGRPVILAVRSSPEPELELPVMAYIGVISAMVACAIATGSLLAIVGAGLFYLSDALIAWNRFVKAYPWGPVAIMVTYHLGQMGLVLSLV